VVDSDDRHAAAVAVDLVDHPEVTASRAVLSPEVDPQRSAYLVGVLRQAAVDELGCTLWRSSPVAGRATGARGTPS
jgi:hypothetical protein